MARNYKQSSNNPAKRRHLSISPITWLSRARTNPSGRIGAAWDHEDGKDLTLQLDLLPVTGGRIVLREPSEANEEKGAYTRRGRSRLSLYLAAAEDSAWELFWQQVLETLRCGDVIEDDEQAVAGRDSGATLH